MKETIVKTSRMNDNEVTIQTDNDGIRETFTYLWIGNHNQCIALIEDKKELQKLYNIIGKILKVGK